MILPWWMIGVSSDEHQRIAPSLNGDIAISWVCALCFRDESLGILNYGKEYHTILYNLYNDGEDVRINHFRRGQGVEGGEGLR